ncbi:MAG: hypothetical protein WAM14_04880 [Candidatus Nitrosopolaris sp.]
MTVVGFNVTKEEREELIAIAREIYVTKFPHPQIQGEYITFLPPGAWMEHSLRQPP